MASHLLFFTAALLTASLVSAEAAGPRPIRLSAEQSGAGVSIRVIAAAAADCTASYALEVESGSGGNFNRSVQRGTARLKSGGATTLATTRIGTVPGERWVARLHVDSCGGRYQETVGTEQPGK